MAHDRTLMNPVGAFADVSDYRTYLTNVGSLIPNMEQRVVDCIASAAIAKGDLVRITTPPAAGTIPKVTTKTSATANTEGYLVYGVALNAAAGNNSPVQVCVRGLCQVNVGSGTAADGNWASLSTTNAGQAAVQTSAPAATAVLGEYLGRFLGAKDANNLAPLFFEHY